METRSILFSALFALSSFSSSSASAVNLRGALDASVQAPKRQVPVPQVVLTSVEKGMNTECKTCPYSLCTNKVAYDAGTNLTLSCRATGQLIQNDTDVWFRTQDDCYVTDWDLTEVSSDPLPGCEGPSTIEHYTTYDTKTRYNTECNVMPTTTEPTTKYLKAGTNVTLTCWKDDDTGEVFDDAMWYKTTDNCYVWRQGLADSPGNSTLENCGPVPFIETRTEAPVPPVSAVETVAKRAELVPQAANYLKNMTVGEEYAPCRLAPNENSTAIRGYEFDEKVAVQCYYDGTFNGSDTNWLLTTDFCYVSDKDISECICDYYRFPNCENFG